MLHFWGLRILPDLAGASPILFVFLRLCGLASLR